MSGRPGHGSKGKTKADKPKNFGKTLKRLFSYMSKRVYLILLVLVLAITSTIFQIRTPKILGEATTEIFKGLMIGKEQIKQGIKMDKMPIDFDKIL